MTRIQISAVVFTQILLASIASGQTNLTSAADQITNTNTAPQIKWTMNPFGSNLDLNHIDINRPENITFITNDATVMAQRNFSNGLYQILRWGFVVTQDEYLKETYGITMREIAGCLIHDSYVTYANAYNSELERQLNRKYGKDIFTEAAAFRERKK